MLSREAFVAGFGVRPVIGMIHLRALPGSPGFDSWRDVLDRAGADLRALQRGGVNAVMFENFGDVPFGKTVDSLTVASMTRVIVELASEVSVPFGVNVLRNDSLGALAIAAATGAAFIRVNVLVAAMLTDQGIIEGCAAELLRRRREISCDTLIFADHLVKHAVPLGAYEPMQLAKDLRLRGCADALISTGRETGGEADGGMLRNLRSTVDAPLLVGSGLNASNARRFATLSDGAIVGTACKREGILSGPVDENLVRELVTLFQAD